MSDDIVPIDLNKAAEEMRERIRMAFVQMLTPEQFQSAVRQELNRFMDPNKTEKSTFVGICRGEFETLVKEQLGEILASNEWTSTERWVGSGYSPKFEIGQAIKEFLAEKGPEILQTFVSTTLAMSFNQFFQEVKNRLARGY